MRAGGGQAGQVEAAEALGRHVELDEGRQDGVALDVQVPRRRHRDLGGDSIDMKKFWASFRAKARANFCAGFPVVTVMTGQPALKLKPVPNS